MRVVPYGLRENLITFIVFLLFYIQLFTQWYRKKSVCNCMQHRGASWNVNIANRSKPREAYNSNKKERLRKESVAKREVGRGTKGQKGSRYI